MVRRKGLNLLLDTHAFLWLIAEPQKLSERVTELIQDSSNSVFLSSVSVWEIVVKHSKGQLDLPEDPKTLVPRMRTMHQIDPLPLSEDSALLGSRLPWHHQDPFDRMLISQAMNENMAIVTADRYIRQYPVQVIW